MQANPGMAVSATTVCNEEPLETTDYKYDAFAFTVNATTLHTYYLDAVVYVQISYNG